MPPDATLRPLTSNVFARLAAATRYVDHGRRARTTGSGRSSRSPPRRRRM